MAAGTVWYWAAAGAGPADWPVYEAFRCQRCGGPAAINPQWREHWGCRTCGRTTYYLQREFRLAIIDDFAIETAYWEAYERAGGMISGQLSVRSPEYLASPWATWHGDVAIDDTGPPY
jgi:ribosomal protein S14